MQQQPGPPLWLFAIRNTGTFLDGHYPVKAGAVHRNWPAPMAAPDAIISYFQIIRDRFFRASFS
jgi:hypothetical protein